MNRHSLTRTRWAPVLIANGRPIGAVSGYVSIRIQPDVAKPVTKFALDLNLQG